MRRIGIWWLLFREWWIEGQVEVVEDQMDTAPIRHRLLMNELRQIRRQLAQLYAPRELLAQALAARAQEITRREPQPPARVASRGHSDYAGK